VDKTTGEYTQEYMDHLKALDEKYKQTDHYSVVLIKNSGWEEYTASSRKTWQARSCSFRI